MNIKLLIATYACIPVRAVSAEGACPVRSIEGGVDSSRRKDQMSWGWVDPLDSHRELALLQQAIVERPGVVVRQVYLYSRFAPGPACARALAILPRLRPAIEFSLAFHVLDTAGSPLTADDVRSGIDELAENGWHVRDWRSEAGGIAVRPIRTAMTARRPARQGDAARVRWNVPAVLSRKPVKADVCYAP